MLTRLLMPMILLLAYVFASNPAVAASSDSGPTVAASAMLNAGRQSPNRDDTARSCETQSAFEGQEDLFQN